jgi:hypothetical protein
MIRYDFSAYKQEGGDGEVECVFAIDNLSPDELCWLATEAEYAYPQGYLWFFITKAEGEQERKEG